MNRHNPYRQKLFGVLNNFNSLKDPKSKTTALKKKSSLMFPKRHIQGYSL